MRTGKSYSSPSEEAQREQTWLSNRKLVLVHNMLADQEIKSYRLGMTYFADMVGTAKKNTTELMAATGQSVEINHHPLKTDNHII